MLKQEGLQLAEASFRDKPEQIIVVRTSDRTGKSKSRSSDRPTGRTTSAASTTPKRRRARRGSKARRRREGAADVEDQDRRRKRRNHIYKKNRRRKTPVKTPKTKKKKRHRKTKTDTRKQKKRKKRIQEGNKNGTITNCNYQNRELPKARTILV